MHSFFQQHSADTYNSPVSEQDESKKLEQLKKMLNDVQIRLSHQLELHPLNTPYLKSNIHIEMGYQILKSASIIKHGLTSYIFGKNLFILIPGLSQIGLIVASLMYTLFDAVLFLGFEISLLKQSMNLKQPHLSSIYNLLQQIQILSSLHLHLSSIQFIQCFSKQEYEEKYTICSQFTEEVKQKYHELMHTQQNLLANISYFLLMSVGALSKLAGSYFLSESLIKAFCPLLIGTPWSSIFIGFMVSTSLGFYFFVSSKSIQNFLQPEQKYLQEVKSSYHQFEQTNQHLNHNHLVTTFFFEKNNHKTSENIVVSTFN